MTVTYSLDVATSNYTSLYGLLFRWKGSIWKGVGYDLLTWCACYAVLSYLYRMALTDSQRIFFEDVCVFFNTYSEFIPMTFMLGFYVTTVYSRWWEIFNNVGWIDTPALLIAATIDGTDDESRMLRRNLIRYLVLTQALVFRDVSSLVKKRFPSMSHLVTAGLMSESEMAEFEKVSSDHIKYWQPMHWVFSLLKKAKRDGRVSDIVFIDLLEKMRQFRVNVLNLTLYDWVPVPLGYTQVVHLAVRSYFLVALLGRQYLITTRVLPQPKTIDLYVPVMTILQFIFFVGWMKVAEVLLNPLGEDDDDFECNYILDRNLQIGLSIVDDAFTNLPPQEKDSFWETRNPLPLYTSETLRPTNPAVGSCVQMETDFDRSEGAEAVMVLPRRRSTASSRMLEWDRSCDYVVPVIRRRKSGSLASVESGTSLGNSLATQPPSRFKSLWKKMSKNAKFDSSFSSRNYRNSRSNSNVSSFPTMSREDSVVSFSNSVSMEGTTEGSRVCEEVDETLPNTEMKEQKKEHLPAIAEEAEMKRADSLVSRQSNSSTETTKRKAVDTPPSTLPIENS